LFREEKVEGMFPGIWKCASQRCRATIASLTKHVARLARDWKGFEESRISIVVVETLLGAISCEIVPNYTNDGAFWTDARSRLLWGSSSIRYDAVDDVP
jgi:hypothetical protein